MAPNHGKSHSEELRGWPFAKALILALTLGSLYVGWKYVKHRWLLPHLWPQLWILYAIAVAAFLVWGAATRFGTKS